MRQVEIVEDLQALETERSTLSVAEILFVGSVGIMFTTIWAICVGKDVGYDQRNYHYYTVYSWLTGRMNYDIAPAGIQNWFNPLVYVPHYWLINHVRPVVTGGIWGAWVGLNFGFVYMLARLVLPTDATWWARTVAFLCAAVGFADSSLLVLTGTTDADNLLSVAVLASLCLLVWAGSSEVPAKALNRAYAAAGVLLGAAAGLKLIFFIYAVAMGLTLLLLWSGLRMNLRRYSAFAAGGVAGFVVTGGYWSWRLWTQYGNPFFPHWNRYFDSPWALHSNFRDMRFPPRSVEAAIQLPFQWLVGGITPSSEDPFRDGRFALLCVLVTLIAAALVGQWIARLWTHRAPTADTNLLVSRRFWWLLLVFSVMSYLVWIKVFAIQRYLIPLGLISGLLLWLLVDWLIPGRAAKTAAFLLMAIFCIVWTRAKLDGDRLPYAGEWYGVELVPEVKEAGTLFVMVGVEPMSYVVPFLPESSRFVYLHPVMVPETETELVRLARDTVARHTGPIRTLTNAPLRELDYSQLRRFRLSVEEGACVQFRTVYDRFSSCRISRADPSGS